MAGKSWYLRTTAKDHKVMLRLYNDGYTYKEIGIRFGVHRTTVSRIIKLLILDLYKTL